MPPIPVPLSVNPATAMSQSSAPPPRDLVVLHFPSPASLASTSYCPTLAQQASVSAHLVIRIHTRSNFLASPEAYSAARRLEHTEPSLDTDNGETQGWGMLQHVLMQLYATTTRVFLDRDEPLTRVDVLVDDMLPASSAQDETAEVGWASVTHVTVEQDNSALMPTSPGPSSSVKVAALGGTFDHLHAGHKILLTLSAWITTERLIVGITGELILPAYYGPTARFAKFENPGYVSCR